MTRLRLVQDDQQAGARKPVARLSLDGLELAGRAILGPVQLDLFSGETVALTGPSGIGKTSLLRVLAGLETRQRGSVERPKNVAVVFQEPTLLPWRNLQENLCLTLHISPEAAEQALASVGLAGRGGDFPGQLSLGQQRRLALARAFAGSPDLLLLDEPFVSLDAALADEMMTLFETLRSGSTVTTLLVTHAESEAKRLASRIVHLSGSPATLDP